MVYLLTYTNIKAYKRNAIFVRIQTKMIMLGNYFLVYFQIVLDHIRTPQNHDSKMGSKPLGKYHCKRFAALDAKMSGKEITTKLIKDAEKMGQIGDDIVQQRIIDKMNEKGWEEPDKMVKNVKTHRSQWFD